MRTWLCAALFVAVSGCGQSKEAEQVAPPSAPIKERAALPSDKGPPATREVAPARDNAAIAPKSPPEDSLEIQGPIPADARQLIVSVTSDWRGTDADLFRYQRDEGGDWQLVDQGFQSSIGRAGLAWGRGTHTAPVEKGEPIKREGDRKSPAGVFAIGKAYGYDQAPENTTLPFQQSSASWRCVNDSASRHYNRVIDTSGLEKDWSEAEEMRRGDELYRLVIEIDHNRIVPTDLAPVPEGGSCIFLHVWRRPSAPTIGCTAMSLANMQTLVRWLDPANHPHLVALPRKRYQSLRQAWRLPALPDPS